ncbi:DNA-binding protein inhibitor ID-1 [Callorhinchus milii]|uniref:DNA-binding protein inhibitor n=1 Tax=Callorhinchus milii TaxID=7868 RepID=K4FYG0_CALMI|nr:DNA-binding protein inhibitor ID-1 [Callorhinchus milii]AFK11302.1 DNA-binding protein inhibitor [Callorhinchus milii]AFM91012.1 DNA-binding protein inhibitor [Callorhinchus milii]
MKVVSASCALKRQGCSGEDMVRCLSEQSISIAKCKMSPLLDGQMSMFLYDMNSCYSKLKELVPTLPQNKKVSKVEILQHVIDYIWDLQVELDTHPGMMRQQAAQTGTQEPTHAQLASLATDVAAIASETPCVSSDDRILCR